MFMRPTLRAVAWAFTSTERRPEQVNLQNFTRLFEDAQGVDAKKGVVTRLLTRLGDQNISKEMLSGYLSALSDRSFSTFLIAYCDFFVKKGVAGEPKISTLATAAHDVWENLSSAKKKSLTEARAVGMLPKNPRLRTADSPLCPVDPVFDRLYKNFALGITVFDCLNKVREPRADLAQMLRTAVSCLPEPGHIPGFFTKTYKQKRYEALVVLGKTLTSPAFLLSFELHKDIYNAAKQVFIPRRSEMAFPCCDTLASLIDYSNRYS
jgi:hypothetical protein